MFPTEFYSLTLFYYKIISFKVSNFLTQRIVKKSFLTSISNHQNRHHQIVVWKTDRRTPFLLSILFLLPSETMDGIKGYIVWWVERWLRLYAFLVWDQRSEFCRVPLLPSYSFASCSISYLSFLSFPEFPSSPSAVLRGNVWWRIDTMGRWTRARRSLLDWSIFIPRMIDLWFNP